MEKDKTKELDIKLITNFLENPRHEAVQTQEEVMRELFSNKKNAMQMYKLAKDICEEGLLPTNLPLVLYNKEKSLYIAYDGNRRIAALKAIAEPEKIRNYVDGNIYNNFCKLNKNYEKSINLSPKVVIIEDEKQAISLIKRIHSGQQDGVGQIKWDSKQKDRFNEKLWNASSLSLNIINGLEKNNLSINEGFKHTDIKRIFGTKGVKNYLGINEENKDYQKLNNEQSKNIKFIMDAVVNEAKSKGDSISRRFNSAKEIVSFVTSLTLPTPAILKEEKSALPLPSEIEINLEISKTANEYTLLEPTKTEIKIHDQEEKKLIKEKNSLINEDWVKKYRNKFASEYSDIESILDLLNKLEFKEGSYATNHSVIAILFRCLIEYATHGFQKNCQKKKSQEIGDLQQNFSQFVNNSKSYMMTNKLCNNSSWKNFPKDVDFQKIQGSIHNPSSQCTKDFLITTFKNMREYLEKCLEYTLNEYQK